MSRDDKAKLMAAGLIVAAIALLVVCGLFFSSVWVIPPGHVGVVTSFGYVDDDVLSAGGPYFLSVWKSVDKVNVQTQKDEEHATVPTKGGLAVQMKAILLWHLDPQHTPTIKREIGETGAIEDKIIDPHFQNAVRDICAEYEPESLYTVQRTEVEDHVRTRISKDLSKWGVIVDGVMLQDPILPPVVADRIQAKIAAEQDVMRLQSVVKQREQEGLANKRQKELDAEAKVAEAKGIAESQKIIQKDLTREYLVYLWIEALKESAKHNNATVYIPTGSDGMPFFKDLAPHTTKAEKP